MGTGHIFALTDSALFGGSGALSNQNSKDVIGVISGSGTIPILYYRAISGSDVDSVAGVYRALPSGSRVIYLAFGVEEIGSSGTFMTKKDFLQRLFIGLTNVKDERNKIVLKDILLRSGTPLNLPTGVNKVYVYSVDGKLVKTLENTGNGIKIDWPSGIYYLVVEREGHWERRKMIVVR